jgi:hypothetical protein
MGNGELVMAGFILGCILMLPSTLLFGLFVLMQLKNMEGVPSMADMGILIVALIMMVPGAVGLILVIESLGL